MIIAIDTRGSKHYQEFIFQIFKIICSKYPQHTFLFISDGSYDLLYKPAGNTIQVAVTQAKIPLMGQLKISSVLKKYKSGVLVAAQIMAYTKVPQCLIAWDKVTQGSLKKANRVVTGSAFAKKRIIEKYKIEEGKIDVVHNGVNDICEPLEFDEKEKIKERYAGGNEYFLSVAISSEGLLNLLKAFSVFKKMQKSKMQLVIFPGRGIDKGFSEKLELYSFKSEVKVLETVNKKEQAAITAAAYAFVYPFTGPYFHLFSPMICNVPVITSGEAEMSEIFDRAALYIHCDDHKDIGDKMMLIYKDEKLRHQLVEKAREQVKKYSPENEAELLWKSIEKACSSIYLQP